jgi:hypothetical protein
MYWELLRGATHKPELSRRLVEVVERALLEARVESVLVLQYMVSVAPVRQAVPEVLYTRVGLLDTHRVLLKVDHIPKHRL